MANNDLNNASLNEATKRQLKTLRQAPVFYNMLNLIPSECTWYISIEDMENHVRRTAEEFLGKDEIKYVTIDPGLKGTREPRAFVWIKIDSRHLIDRSKSNDANMVVAPRVERYSEDLKRFGDQFAPTVREDGTPISRKKRLRILKNDRGDTSIVAIPIDLSRVIYRIFDVENRGFLDTYGSDTPARRCALKCSARYDKKGERNVLSAIRVTKYFEGVGDRAQRPRPVTSFSDRDSDGERRYRSDDDE